MKENIKIEYPDILIVKRNVLAFYNECVHYKCIYDDSDIFEILPYWNYINIDKNIYDDFDNELIENGSLIIIFSMCASEIGNISNFFNIDIKIVLDIINQSLTIKSGNKNDDIKRIIIKWINILIENKIEDDVYNKLQLDSEYLFEKYIKSYFVQIYKELQDRITEN